LNALLTSLDRQPKRRLWVAALALMILIGTADFFSGFEIAFSLFYLGPVALAAWSISRTGGLVLSAACAGTWLLANLLAGLEFSSPLITYWNTVTLAVFFLVVTLLLSALRRHLEHERQLSRTDFLTGALNRRAFYEVAAAELARTDRYQHPLSLIYLDLDNFKSINDRLGHNAGDALLQSVASTMARGTRAIDTTARMGGDEFVVLMPETGQEAARMTGSRLQQALLKEMREHHWPVTFSIGILACAKPPSSVDEMVGLADQLMYAAKKSGKNAIACSPEAT
jgi:diguanylate cyclase (GGDEF)-like protein